MLISDDLYLWTVPNVCFLDASVPIDEKLVGGPFDWAIRYCPTSHTAHRSVDFRTLFQMYLETMQAAKQLFPLTKWN
jgi:hypothetical protein